MRLGRLHRIVATALTALALVFAGSPAWSNDVFENPADDETSPPIFDLFVLRPVGIIGIGIGSYVEAAGFAPSPLLRELGFWQDPRSLRGLLLGAELVV